MTHPLVLALLSVGLSLYAIARRQDRARRAALAESIARFEGLDRPAPAAATDTAVPRARQTAADLRATVIPTRPAIARKADWRLADTLRAPEPAPAPTDTATTSRLAALPPKGVAQRGLAQIQLSTTRPYRLFSLLLVLLTLLLVFGTSAFSPPPGEDSLLLQMIGYGMCLAALWHAAWVMLWRLDYDQIGLSNRNRLFQPEARMWRALTNISSDGPFITLFHFADGLVMRVPNFIKGRRQMMRTAQSWLRHGHAPDRP